MKNTVLVVEDEQDTADLLKSILEREGFLVVYAKDGRQATTLIETMRAPSLVLLDMVIPYVSGFELLRVIRHHPDWQRVPVIMVSANNYEPEIQRALAEGATDYLTKSNRRSELLKKIQNALGSTSESAGEEGIPDSPDLKASHKGRRTQRGVSDDKPIDNAA